MIPSKRTSCEYGPEGFAVRVFQSNGGGELQVIFPSPIPISKVERKAFPDALAKLLQNAPKGQLQSHSIPLGGASVEVVIEHREIFSTEDFRSLKKCAVQHLKNWPVAVHKADIADEMTE